MVYIQPFSLHQQPRYCYNYVLFVPLQIQQMLLRILFIVITDIFATTAAADLTVDTSAAADVT